MNKLQSTDMLLNRRTRPNGQLSLVSFHQAIASPDLENFRLQLAGAASLSFGGFVRVQISSRKASLGGAPELT